MVSQSRLNSNANSHFSVSRYAVLRVRGRPVARVTPFDSSFYFFQHPPRSQHRANSYTEYRRFCACIYQHSVTDPRPPQPTAPVSAFVVVLVRLVLSSRSRSSLHRLTRVFCSASRRSSSPAFTSISTSFGSARRTRSHCRRCSGRYAGMMPTTVILWCDADAKV